MEREELLKQEIKDQFKSVLAFAKETGIPESSLRDCFTRGIETVRTGTLVEICRKLNIDLYSLLDGAIVYCREDKETAGAPKEPPTVQECSRYCERVSVQREYVKQRLQIIQRQLDDEVYNIKQKMGWMLFTLVLVCTSALSFVIATFVLLFG